MASPHLYPPSPIPSYVAPHAPSPALSAYEQQQQQQQPPPFAPFFTLIANPASTVHKHPIVHYVFADDDFDPVTETALAAADSAASANRPRDRVVVVDIAADGETVAAAHSLSKEWQVVGVNTAPAPQWMASVEDSSGGGGGNKAGGVVGGGGLMLTVEGTERSGLQLKRTESVYELAEIFAERMALIKRVIDYGQKSSNASS